MNIIVSCSLGQEEKWLKYSTSLPNLSALTAFRSSSLPWLGQGPMEFGEHKPESCSGAPPSLRAGEDATLQFLKQVRILEQWSAMFYDYHQI